MSKEQIEEIIRNFVAEVSCPQCRNEYSSDGIKLIGGQNNILIVQVSCSNCSTHMTATVLVNNYSNIINNVVKKIDSKLLSIVLNKETTDSRNNGSQISISEIDKFKKDISKFFN